jgi:metal-responsive CopG/Arc/MetJ family transcriptional regulator
MIDNVTLEKIDKKKKYGVSRSFLIRDAIQEYLKNHPPGGTYDQQIILQ